MGESLEITSNGYLSLYYWLRPTNSGGRTVSVGATYGRIGSERGEAFGTKDLKTPYQPFLYWIRYYEKISKGYTDQTEIYLAQSPTQQAAPTAEAKKSKAEPTPAQTLYDELLRYAKGVVRENLVSQTVTVRQVEEGWKIWKKLGTAKDVEEFNQTLSALIALSPRKCRFVKDLLAMSKDDFGKIVDREEALLNAMAVLTNGSSLKKAEEGFSAWDIKVFGATDAQKEKVLRLLPPELKGKILNVYRVIPHGQRDRFNAYLAKKHIKTVKELWHGSRNENWLNIIKSGLLLNPNAVTTGKMLGYGVYFAPSALKSWGYTSAHGSFWAHGNSNRAFMGLFATAYGDPLVPKQARHYTQSELDREHKNCVHAKSGMTMSSFSALRNDEIVFYDEDAILLNYIVEFSA